MNTYWPPHNDIEIMDAIDKIGLMDPSSNTYEELEEALVALKAVTDKHPEYMPKTVAFRMKYDYGLPGDVVARAFGLDETEYRAFFEETAEALKKRGGSPSYLLPKEIFENPIICDNCGGKGYWLDAIYGMAAYAPCPKCGGMGCLK